MASPDLPKSIWLTFSGDGTTGARMMNVSHSYAPWMDEYAVERLAAAEKAQQDAEPDD